VVLGVWLCIHLWSGDLGPLRVHRHGQQQQTQPARELCYVFTGLALAGSLFPFGFPSLFKHSDLHEAPLGVLRGCARVVGDKDTFYPKEVRCDDAGNIQWIISIGGTVANEISAGQNGKTADAAANTNNDKPTPQQVIGGLVVPLYLVVLALFGGAISMTRRVPEYQRRAMDAHDPLTNDEAREYLVFQIMQLFTAPLLAVTAYYILNPSTSQQTVVLGFASGFASEPILVMIRALVDKLKPAQEAPGPISVNLAPSPATVPVGGTMQFTAAVPGSANRQVTWLIDPPDGTAGTISQSGYYIAPNELPTKAVTITARSVADPAKSDSAGVKVEPVVRVLPATVTLRAEENRQFTAQVLGLPSPDVDWSLDPNEGTVIDGLYTAPKTVVPERKTVTLTARSRADATRTGKASILLQ